MACWDIVGKALGAAGVPAARRHGQRPDQGLRQRLVHGRAHARGVPRGGAARGRARLPRAEVRPVRRRAASSSTTTSACARSRWSRRCATRSARRSRSWSRCTAASRRTRRSGSPGCWSRSSRRGSRSRSRRRTSRRWRRSPSTRRCRSRPASASTTGSSSASCSSSQAADIIQPDIGHIGGILETRKLAATAETHYVLVAPHNVGGPVLTAANLHLAACTPNFKIQEHFNDFADAGGQAGGARAARRCVDGYFALPDAPGPRRRARRRLRRRAPAAPAPTSTSSPQDWHFRGTK